MPYLAVPDLLVGRCVVEGVQFQNDKLQASPRISSPQDE